MVLFCMLVGYLFVALGFLFLREAAINQEFEQLLNAIVAGLLAGGFFYLGVVANM
ncbi:MAG: hypothetical protein AAFR21_14990 [Pseudomonadota bacterium]